MSSGADPVGKVFLYRSKVYRLISDEYKEFILEFLHSDLYSELLQKQLILPATITTDLSIYKNALILEHPALPCPTLPYEWTFHMLKDACLTLLNVFFICQRYGYTLKDAHPWNISFLYTRPIFLDFGSFCKKIQTSIESFSLEFFPSFYYPLKLWSKGNFYFAHRMLSDDYYQRFDSYPSPFCKYNRYLWREYCAYAVKNHINNCAEKIAKKRIFLDEFSLPSLYKKICKIENKTTSSWMHYHDGILNNPSTLSRFMKLLDLLKKYNIDSIIDLAGNQGAFSLFALQNSNIHSSICADYDEGALDSLYCSMKKENRTVHITPVLMNVLFPIHTNSPAEQPKTADAAIALALTHHLLLTKKYPIDLVFSKIKSYTKKYVLIEFMPLGLWDGVHPPPPIPEWYTLKWFRTNFIKYFELLEEQEICTNRIAFFGKIRTCTCIDKIPDGQHKITGKLSNNDVM